MIHVEPKDIEIPQIHAYLLGGVAPRPIALVSTLSDDNIPNLAPFSYFNAFGANPPTVAFSPGRRGTDASVKDTYTNLLATNECVIQAVTHAMVQQVNVSSGNYPADVDEFAKCGLTPVPADLVKPSRVQESPFQMECILKQVIPLGEGRGSGNLAICEVIKFHIDEELFAGKHIHPDLIDLVGRNSGSWYTRASGDALFEVFRPFGKPGIGYDALPDFVRESVILSANDLGQLALAESVPTVEEATERLEAIAGKPFVPAAFMRLERTGDYQNMLVIARQHAEKDTSNAYAYFERTAKTALQRNDIPFALAALIFGHHLTHGSA